MGTIASIATMLGLFGTVYGLILAFGALGDVAAAERAAQLALVVDAGDRRDPGLVDPDHLRLPVEEALRARRLDHRVGEWDDRRTVPEDRERMDPRQGVDRRRHGVGPDLGCDAVAYGPHAAGGVASRSEL